MAGDIELAALIVAAGMVVSALILGVCLIVAAGRTRKRE